VEGVAANAAVHTSPCSAARNAAAGGSGSKGGLRPEFLKDLFQRHNAGTEGVAIVLDDLGHLPQQGFGLFVCQFEVHAPEMGALINCREDETII
jgi:hypothetical protein